MNFQAFSCRGLSGRCPLSVVSRGSQCMSACMHRSCVVPSSRARHFSRAPLFFPRCEQCLLPVRPLARSLRVLLYDRDIHTHPTRPQGWRRSPTTSPPADMVAFGLHRAFHSSIIMSPASIIKSSKISSCTWAASRLRANRCFERTAQPPSPPPPSRRPVYPPSHAGRGTPTAPSPSPHCIIQTTRRFYFYRVIQSSPCLCYARQASDWGECR